MHKAAEAFRSIGEVSRLVGVPPHVLRYWETQFPLLAPVKRADGRRYYRPEDLHLAAGLCELLRDEGMTTRGAARLMARDKGATIRARGLARLPERFRGEDGSFAEADPSEEEKADSLMSEATPNEPAERPATMPTNHPDEGAATRGEAESTAPAPTAGPPQMAAPAEAPPAEIAVPARRPAPRSTELPLFPGLAPAAPPPGVWLPRLAAAAESLRALPAPRKPPVQMLRLRDRVAALIEDEV